MDELDVPDYVESAVEEIRDLWIELGGSSANPFANIAANFACSSFRVQSYLWTVEVPPPNFIWRDIELSWYKYFGRSMSINREMTEAECKEMLQECAAALIEITRGKVPTVDNNSTITWI